MFEIELPTEKGGISYIDDDTHPIDDNMVICVKPGQIRHTRLPFKRYYIHMILKEGELYDTVAGLPNFIEMEDTAHIRKLFQGMCDNFGVGLAENELMLHSMILELVCLLKRHSPEAKMNYQAKNNRHEAIQKTIDYIKLNLSSDMSLEKLACDAGFAPTYFHKLFKASTGKTIREYIEDQRIKKSINLLINTDMTLTQIAYECGFSSQSYFSYAFKRNMGMTPRQFVKETLEKYNR